MIKGEINKRGDKHRKSLEIHENDEKTRQKRICSVAKETFEPFEMVYSQWKSLEILDVYLSHVNQRNVEFVARH